MSIGCTAPSSGQRRTKFSCIPDDQHRQLRRIDVFVRHPLQIGQRDLLDGVAIFFEKVRRVAVELQFGLLLRGPSPSCRS